MDHKVHTVHTGRMEHRHYSRRGHKGYTVRKVHRVHNRRVHMGRKDRKVHTEHMDHNQPARSKGLRTGHTSLCCFDILSLNPKQVLLKVRLSDKSIDTKTVLFKSRDLYDSKLVFHVQFSIFF